MTQGTMASTGATFGARDSATAELPAPDLISGVLVGAFSSMKSVGGVSRESVVADIVLRSVSLTW